HRDRETAFLGLGSLRGNRGRFFRRQLEMADNRIRAGNDSAFHISIAKAGNDVAIYDVMSEAVRHDRLEPVTHLDPQLSLVGCNQKDNSVIVFRIAQTPVTSELVSIIRDIIVIE